MNVFFLLRHSLKEQEDINTDFEDGFRRANVVIFKGILGIRKLRNHTLVILPIRFNAKVVYLHIDSVLFFEELDDILSAISYNLFKT